ncbi:acyl-CoA dehydrogenase family protein [Paenibacillus harenae]|uniref:acyl-CoA dehydrogenase family protein n=1 Tax=Paenibacillus harenae TaxID=306543 RepID=UPI0004030407|nr:acyl-CoA dehydrogenase family protein [Paenibacillus harenae]
MRFQLSEELEMTREAVRHFAEKEAGPNAVKRDSEERFERGLFAQMGELGLCGIVIPERYDGAGSGFLTYVVALEELARVCASTAAVLAAHTAFSAWPILQFGSESLKRKALTVLAGGRRLAAGGLPSQGKQDNGIVAAADENGYVLSGKHPLVLNAGAADDYVLFASLERRQSKADLTAFLIESGTPGFRTGNKVQKLGLRSLMTAEVVLENCRIPAGNIIGKPGQGSRIAESLVDIARLGTAAQALGIAQGALEAATEYAKQRKQFGLLIGRRQGISFKLADMATRIEAARLLAYQAAWRKDEGLSFAKDAAIASSYAVKTAINACLEAIQVFGGYGYMREYRMERFSRDAKCLETSIGTGGMDTDIHSRILMK